MVVAHNLFVAVAVADRSAAFVGQARSFVAFAGQAHIVVASAGLVRSFVVFAELVVARRMFAVAAVLQVPVAAGRLAHKLWLRSFVGRVDNHLPLGSSAAERVLAFARRAYYWSCWDRIEAYCSTWADSGVFAGSDCKDFASESC